MLQRVIKFCKIQNICFLNNKYLKLCLYITYKKVLNTMTINLNYSARLKVVDVLESHNCSNKQFDIKPERRDQTKQKIRKDIVNDQS